MDCVVIGGSAGSFEALQIIYKRLIPKLPWPVVICLHVHKSLKRSGFIGLSYENNHFIKEADDKEKLLSNVTYLAPPNYHLLIEKHFCFSLNIDEQVNYARPSIDVLFESAAVTYGQKLIGILLSGSNVDGAKGLEKICLNGGQTVVQDPRHSLFPEMPKSALRLFEPNFTLAAIEIANFLNLTAKKSNRSEGRGFNDN